MSKKALLKANILYFIGGNLANALNFALNIALVKIDETLLNDYTTFTSLSLILLVPSLVTMRIFTVFGNPIIINIKRLVNRNRNIIFASIMFVLLSLIPLNFFLTNISNGNWGTSSLLIILAITGFVANIFRGIQQNEENHVRSVISQNVEAFGRLLLGFIFAIPLKMGISGVLIGHVLGLLGSMLVCFEYKHINHPLEHNDEVRLRNLFLNTFFMTVGLELFSNFDIVYTNYILKGHEAETDFSTVTIFRKIIFFGVFSISSVYLTVGAKNRFTKKFLYFTTILVSLFISLGAGLFFYFTRDMAYQALDKGQSIITDSQFVLILLGTALMSTAYLLSNWLFTLKKNRFIYLPVIACICQALIFIIFGKNLSSLIYSFLSSSFIFFALMAGVGFVEIWKTRHHNLEENKNV